jgi:hypothetical protein
MVVYAAWRGEPAGAFGLLVWTFAGASAYANYQYGARPEAPGDAWWFFPAMSIAGPALLEVTVRRIRRWVQTTAGRYERPLPHFRVTRWLVAPKETGVAWRLAVTEGYSRPEDAIAAARVIRTGRRDASGEWAGDTVSELSARQGAGLLPPVSPDTDEATPNPTPESAAPRHRTRRPRATASADDRLAQAYGDGLDPATGRPWTSRPLARRARVHHGTAAAFLRRRREAEPDPSTATGEPGGVAANGHRPVGDGTRALALASATEPASVTQPEPN